MVTFCPLCEDSHPVEECPHLRSEATWADGGTDAVAAQSGDIDAMRVLLAARAMEPLVRTLNQARREVEVLETVNTDDDQRRRQVPVGGQLLARQDAPGGQAVGDLPDDLAVDRELVGGVDSQVHGLAALVL